ncbi:MAG TPA: UDP-N-acetylmuramate dehydrogenase [Thermoanaerobaculia bacterium]|jgi:UDP-N-acetylmuramate dehydrogenase|nr:UDP-N-acetylmuramate dehydrogenase [Thermoanaerobaculia bacterium]
MQLQENVSLAPLTTIGIGGPARFFFRAKTVDDVLDALQWAREHEQPVFFLGGGSNLLISDDGFRGLVVHLDLHGITVEKDTGGSAMVKVAAGEPWDRFVKYAVRREWAGIECLSGIPGSTGATPIQNVGAYGQDVSETIARVEALDRTTGRVTWFTNEECRFGYRSSIFKSTERDRYVVLSVTFRLRPGGPATVKYPELQTYVEERGVSLDDLSGVRESVIAIRKRKGMVLDKKDPDTRSDGSFFMNPVLTAEQYAAFAERAPDAPHYPSGDEVKLSAAWLIEHAGFQKGFIHGNVGLSTKHTLAVVNRGHGTAAEVLALVGMIQDQVREKFGVELHPEPNFIGFE